MDPSQFAVTYNGIEFDLLKPTRAPAEVRAELGLGPDNFVLGTSANLKAWKRIDRLLHALAAVRRPELRLLIVGDGEERPRLEALADRLGVRSRTVFTGLQDKVADFVQSMDAFCLPSDSRESFGNSAVEAMGLGRPDDHLRRRRGDDRAHHRRTRPASSSTTRLASARSCSG